jgi:DNA polymerase V
MKIILDVLETTGITATAGIGTNLFLCKVAMDIVAKKMKADKDGVRIASLDEMTYRKLLWDHTPLTDFWRVGHGYQRKLEANNLFTMGDIALCSIENEDLLYSLFGINAELLIDHAWGYEPCEITHIKNYKPQGKSLGSGQVLHCAYDYKKTKLVVKEMIDSLALDLCDKRLLTNQVVLSIGYDIENLTDEKISANYKGEICVDYLGRKIPKHSHGTVNFEIYTSASKILMDGVISLFERIVNKDLLVRRINIAATGLIYENQLQENNGYEQLDLFDDYKVKEMQKKKLDKIVEKEKKAQEALLQIKKKYGKNSIIKGMNLEDGATMKDRNEQIGGHKA